VKQRFTSNYTGFCGQIDYELPDALTTVCWRLGSPGPPFSGRNGAIQWFNPFHGERIEPLPPTPQGQLFLAGLVWNETGTLFALQQSLNDILTRNRFGDLATIVEHAAGCYVGNDRSVYLWVGSASGDHVFFRKQGCQLRWSTNPLDVVSSKQDLDTWALRRCCHTTDVWVYKNIDRVEQGHLIKIQPCGNVTSMQFDQFLPDPYLSSHRFTLESYVQHTREAITSAIRPLHGERVGIMLSGGSGSGALLNFMKEDGLDVIAYHMESPDPAGSEWHFAESVGAALDVPVRRLIMRTGADFLSPQWEFSHPDGHPWPAWYDQIAQAARQDRVRLLVIAGGDDHTFGPEMEYSMHSVLFARLSWREKIEMIKGMFSTDWNIWDILRSAWPWPPRQLIGPSSLAGPIKEDREMRRADFMTPLDSAPRGLDDIALQHPPCFSPQNMAIEHTILKPNGITLYYPYHHRAVQKVSLALPAAYRLIPHLERLVPDLTSLRSDLERVVDKPILRLACRGTKLPPEVVWRTWAVCTQAACQTFCISHPEILRALLGSGSCLEALGMVVPSRLDHVLSSRPLIRENYATLIASAMGELFLKKSWQNQCRRGGPLWM
jgi:hypothetical protein